MFLDKGSGVDRQKDVSLFLDETGLPAAQQRDSSRLKLKTRLYVDQQLTHMPRFQNKKDFIFNFHIDKRKIIEFYSKIR